MLLVLVFSVSLGLAAGTVLADTPTQVRESQRRDACSHWQESLSCSWRQP
jgi:hypothetical protein